FNTVDTSPRGDAHTAVKINPNGAQRYPSKKSSAVTRGPAYGRGGRDDSDGGWRGEVSRLLREPQRRRREQGCAHRRGRAEQSAHSQPRRDRFLDQPVVLRLRANKQPARKRPISSRAV